MKPENQRLITNGLVMGAIGYALIGTFFAAVNVLQGRSPLLTAAILGNALLGQPATSIEAAPVAVYNGLHLVVFLVLGTAAAWMAGLVERRPHLWYLLLFFGVFVFFHLFGAVATLAAPSGNTVPLPLVLVAGLLAVAGMAAWLGRAYPGMTKGVRSAGDFEDPFPVSGEEPRRS